MRLCYIRGKMHRLLPVPSGYFGGCWKLLRSLEQRDREMIARAHGKPPEAVEDIAKRYNIPIHRVEAIVANGR